MPRLRRDERCGEAGNASLEFLVAAVVLLVPLIYLALTLSTIQGGMLAAEGAAREAARSYAAADDDRTGRANADAAVAVALSDRRIPRSAGDLSLGCDPEPASASCRATGVRVTVTVRAAVELPFVPAVFGLDHALRIPLQARAVAPIVRVGGGG